MEKLLEFIQAEIERVENSFLSLSQQLGRLEFEIANKGRDADASTDLRQMLVEGEDANGQATLLAMREKAIYLRGEKQYLNIYHQNLLHLFDLAQNAKGGASHTIPLASLDRLSLLINAQESERLRLSRQIHDGPAQSLANFILRAEIATRLMDKDVEKARQELRDLKETASKTLQEVRDTIFELRPMMLDDLGLDPTLAKYIETLNARTGNRITYRSSGVEARFDRTIEVMTFRSLQDLVTKALRHHESSLVDVHMSVLGGLLIVEFKDDGDDLSAQDMNNPENFPVMLLRNRVLEFGGRFEMRPGTPKGTEIIFTIPISLGNGNAVAEVDVTA